MTSPTARTLAELRKQGYVAEVVERWNAYTKTRKDLFGGIDLVAVREGETLGVQATVASAVSTRLAKLRAEPRLAVWLAAGNRLQVWGWAKRKVRLKTKTAVRWCCRVEDVQVQASVQVKKRRRVDGGQRKLFR